MRLAEAYRLIAMQTAQAEELSAQVTVLQARVGDLERQARRDSSTSSRPPSSDSPYKPPSPWGVVASARKSGGRGAAP